jgi:hypothetical protein
MDDLPGAAGKVSADVGTRVSTDTAITPTPDNADDFFPWMAIDQSTGTAYVDYYSTAGDPQRGKSDFYVAPATASGAAKPTVGERRKVSAIRSDYTTGSTACCIFGNDYGDYTGIDAAQGIVVPVWTSRASAADDGDALISVPEGARLQLVDDASSIVEGAGADGDGVPEPGEGVTIGERLRNPSTVGATQVQGTLSTTVPGVQVTSAGSAYPDIAAAGGTAGNATPFAAKLPVTIPCNSRVDFRLTLQTAQEPEIVPFTVPVGCNGAIGGVSTTGPGGTTTPGSTGATGTVGSLTASLAITREKLRTIVRRGLRVRLRCNERCTAKVEMRVDKKTAKRLKLKSTRIGTGTVRLTKSGRVSVRVKITKKARARLARLRSVTVAVTAKVTKADGKPGPQLARKIKLKR